MITHITKLSSGMYQLDDNPVPIDQESLLALANKDYGFDSDSLDIWKRNLDAQGAAALETDASKGVVVDMYEVEYPAPMDPNKETEDLASHLNEKRDFITQYLFPQTETNDVIVGLREDILPTKKETGPMKQSPQVSATASLRVIADAIKDHYKTDNKVTLPNSADFSGDLWPSSGNPVTREQEDWHAGNKKEQSDVTRENKAQKEFTSPLMTGDDRSEDVASHIKEPQVLPKHLASIGNQSVDTIRQIIADLTFTKEPDGTVEIEMTDAPIALPTAPAATNPAPAGPPAVPIPADNPAGKKSSSLEIGLGTIRHTGSGARGMLLADQPDPRQVHVVSVATGKREVWYTEHAVATPTRAWVIDRRANKVLLGTECNKSAGIELTDADGKVLKSMAILKQGHTWRELIPQAVWQEELV